MIMTPPSASPLILVVEDDPDTLSAVAAILSTEGYRIIEASSGSEGMRMARTSRPDAILLDLGLPEINGLDLAQLLSRDPLTAAIPLIALTGSWLAADPLVLREAGFAGALRKPLRAPLLVAQVREALLRAHDVELPGGLERRPISHPSREAVMENNGTPKPNIIAELNDLLQLDHDAVQAYTVAIESLENDSFRETLRRFRADHERHITELTKLVQANGGSPAQTAHLSTGIFKLALQQVGRAAGDRGILLAFEANERQVRDKYWRSAEQPHPVAIQTVLRRNAEDEEHHYSWAIETLRRMGMGEDSTTRQVTEILEQVHARTADLLEGAERSVNEQVERLRQSNPDRPTR
jgi:uncharacterized protein (TIGR02284 family)